MPDSTYPLKIKNFGKDRAFNNVDELRDALAKDYQGMHVSIVYSSKPNGLLKTVFASVSDDGTVHHSYGDESEVDFNLIAASLLK